MNKMREQFNEWYAKRHPAPTHKNPTWAHASMCDDWEVWQAALTSVSAGQEKPFGYILRANDGNETFFKNEPVGFKAEKWRGLMEVIELYTHPAPAAPQQCAASLSNSVAAGETAEKISCPRCKGTGESSLDAALFWGEHKCSDCSGKGFNWEPTEAARQPAPVVAGCRLCGSAIGHDLNCPNHPVNAKAPFEQYDEHKAFLATYLDSARKASDNTSAEMILWHANRHWNGKAGEMWRARAALAATAAPVLSDEQIGEIANNFKFKDHWQSNAEAIRFARAILASTTTYRR